MGQKYKKKPYTCFFIKSHEFSSSVQLANLGGIPLNNLSNKMLKEYCGKDVGLFSTKHKECEAIHRPLTHAAEIACGADLCWRRNQSA